MAQLFWNNTFFMVTFPNGYKIKRSSFLEESIIRRYLFQPGLGEQVRDGQRDRAAEGVRRGRRFDEDGIKVSLLESL